MSVQGMSEKTRRQIVVLARKFYEVEKGEDVTIIGSAHAVMLGRILSFFQPKQLAKAREILFATIDECCAFHIKSNKKKKVARKGARSRAKG